MKWQIRPEEQEISILIVEKGILKIKPLHQVVLAHNVNH